jgi:hypothetical protein
MIIPPPVKILVARCLRDAANSYTHTTTRKTTTRRAMRLMSRGGGRARFGYTPAVMSDLVEQSVGMEVGNQLKGPLQPGSFNLPLATASASFIATLRHLPFWIALDSGARVALFGGARPQRLGRQRQPEIHHRRPNPCLG